MHISTLIFTTFALSSTIVYAANCSQGQYVDGNHQCQYCAPGTYSNQTPNTSGTTTCQTAQTGWYACGPQTVNGNNCYGATDQQQCPADTNPHKSYSPVGSTNVNQCQAAPISGVTNNPSCSNSSNVNGHDFCPSEQGNAPNPNPSSLNRKRHGLRCPAHHKLCPVFHGRGGKECIDPLTDAESCGGCVAFDDPEATGKDCTSIEKVDQASCVKGECVVEFCRKGYTPSLDRKSCIPDPHSKGGQAKKRNDRNTNRLRRTL
ncbi:hypothetical protein FS837_001387 [Tulasnella sp. UAMH 9824]|nr:hypothetical protein FS837_001387 [Tulasnella sp. UAMH 9824]